MTRRPVAPDPAPTPQPPPRDAADTSGVAPSPRDLPSVDELIRALQAHAPAAENAPSHEALVASARAVIADARQAVLSGGAAVAPADLVARLQERLAQRQEPALRSVINATGVIINTNLGRAPLAAEALAAMAEVARGYSNLEYDLDAGRRGSRHAHVRELLCALTGAEDALAVNNNAAAVLVVLSALAAGREVIVSRGELVEIGGGFRVPDVMRQGGAKLVEVGTTNRTRVVDYASAITADTAAILAVHPSNFRVVGFTESPALADLANLAHARGIPLVHDLGSGCLLDTGRFGLAHEPTPSESVNAGVDVVCFSGDKLLGGPQAGLIVGASALLAPVARHPLMRAVRIDKLTLAALEATLRLHRDGRALERVPVWRAIAAPLDSLWERAKRWTARLAESGVAARVEAGESTIGGGSLPGEVLPTALCVIEGRPDGVGGAARDMAALSKRLRAERPAVVCRLYSDALYLDPRTVSPTDDDALIEALQRALAAT